LLGPTVCAVWGISSSLLLPSLSFEIALLYPVSGPLQSKSALQSEQNFSVFDMVSATEHPFRILDLPPELRCCVYNHIDTPSTCHTLDRVDSPIKENYWPAPPKEQIYDSRITLIKPPNPRSIDILLTCRLINEEARPILKRRVEVPVRYLVDYSAARAILSYGGILQSCLVAAPLSSAHGNESVCTRTFLHTCQLAISQTRRTMDRTRCPRTIEMTITQKNDVTYGKEVRETMRLIEHLRYYWHRPARLVIVYKSPLPTIQTRGNSPSAIEASLLQCVPIESRMSHRGTGIFARPLNEDAFEKHLEGLDIY
jgi:hypothetical protein